MTQGVLQISSTTRNLVPRFKGWSKGKRLGKDGAQHKIGTWGLSREHGIEASLELKFKKSSRARLEGAIRSFKRMDNCSMSKTECERGFRASRISIACDTRTDHKKVARELHTKPSASNIFGNRGVLECQVSILWNCGLWAHHVG